VEFQEHPGLLFLFRLDSDYPIYDLGIVHGIIEGERKTEPNTPAKIQILRFGLAFSFDTRYLFDLRLYDLFSQE
jgi:hypothetical protein